MLLPSYSSSALSKWIGYTLFIYSLDAASHSLICSPYDWYFSFIFQSAFCLMWFFSYRECLNQPGTLINGFPGSFYMDLKKEIIKIGQILAILWYILGIHNQKWHKLMYFLHDVM